MKVVFAWCTTYMTVPFTYDIFRRSLSMVYRRSFLSLDTPLAVNLLFNNSNKKMSKFEILVFFRDLHWRVCDFFFLIYPCKRHTKWSLHYRGEMIEYTSCIRITWICIRKMSLFNVNRSLTKRGREWENIVKFGW